MERWNRRAHGDAAPLPPRSWAASSLIRNVINGTSVKDGLQQALLDAMLNTVAAKVAGGIGDSKDDGALNSATHKIAHVIAGCALGAVKASDKGGCAPGAIGGVVGEMMAEAMGNSPEMRAFYSDQDKVYMAGLFGGLAAGIAGGDAEAINVGTWAGSNAAANNECGRTNMCGSGSTRVNISGNRVAPLLDFAHSEIQISNGYEFFVLEGQPGYGNGNGYLEGRSNGANMGDAFTIELEPPVGKTTTQFANDLRTAAAGYKDDLVYSFPSPRFGFNNLNGGYNSNSYVGGILDAVARESGFRYVIQGAATRQGFRVPGMENPIPLNPVAP